MLQQCYRILSPTFLQRSSTRHIGQKLANPGTKASCPQVTSNPFQFGISEVIDVRTSAEFEKDHIPGAINLPVLFGNERAVVGKKYKENQFQARKIGASLVSKNISGHIDKHFIDKPQDYAPLIYCWRGGQRSYSLALILSQIGFNVFVLDGGYKHYRSIVRKELDDVSWCDFKVISGLTGSGKTLILQKMKEQGCQTIDLEAIAHHKGSVLGLWYKDSQPSQKMFESRLRQHLSDLDQTQPIWVESESPKLGSCSIPSKLFYRMCIGQRLEIVLPMEERVNYILNDYHYWLKDRDKLIDIVLTMLRYHGKNVVDRWILDIKDQNWRKLVHNLLTVHYDPLYIKSQKSYNHSQKSTVIIPLTDLSDVSVKNASKKMISSIS